MRRSTSEPVEKNLIDRIIVNNDIELFYIRLLQVNWLEKRTHDYHGYLKRKRHEA